MPVRDLKTFIKMIPRVAAEESIEEVHRLVLSQVSAKDRRRQMDVWAKLASGGTIRRHRSTADEIQQFAQSAGIRVKVVEAPVQKAPVTSG